jgi:hypothetical protein
MDLNRVSEKRRKGLAVRHGPRQEPQPFRFLGNMMLLTEYRGMITLRHRAVRARPTPSRRVREKQVQEMHGFIEETQ